MQNNDILETHGPFETEGDFARFCMDNGSPTVAFCYEKDRTEANLYKLDDTEIPWLAYIPEGWFPAPPEEQKE